ncbi:Methyltransferase-like protein 23 [Savitreella phatthalungensis]
MQMLKIIIDALERSAQELDERFYETFLDTEMSRDNEPLLQEFSTLSQTPDEIEELCETRPPQDVRYFYNNRHPLRLDDDSIIVQEQPWLLTSGGITGHRTWEASLSLTDLLVSDPALIKDKCVLELGAGLGLLTCVCAKLGASSVTATDGEPSVVAKLKLTAERNMLEHIITAEKLEFGQDSLLERKKWDVVLAADVAYEDELIKDVLRTLRRLLDNSQPLVIFAATRRRPETMSFLRSTSNAMGLRLQQVLPSSTPGLALQSSEVVLFSIDLKPTALTAYDSDLSCERLAIVP